MAGGRDVAVRLPGLGIRDLTQQHHGQVGVLEDQAGKQGLSLLREDGWRKVRAGMTTPEEVLRVSKV